MSMRVVRTALTFDDVLLIPAHSTVVPARSLAPHAPTRGIEINIPVVSAAMDTVTEASLAIAIAQEGGIGIVHKNLTPARQAAEVAKVKRFESGVVKDPITIPPTMTVRELDRPDRAPPHLRPAGRRRASRVVGIVTNRDLRFETRLDAPVSAIMTPGDRLVTVPEGTDLETAKALMHRHRLERVLVVTPRPRAAGPHHRQGHPQGDRASERVQGRATGACASARRSASRPTTRSAPRCSSRPASTCSSSTPRTGTRRACSTAWPGSRSASRRSRSSAATSRPRAARRRSPTTARTASRSASARARSARRASSPASACRRSRRSSTRSRARRRPASRSSPTAASATPATSRRRSRPARPA